MERVLFFDGQNTKGFVERIFTDHKKAQMMAAHESPRTTKLYNRTKDEGTLDEVERIILE